MPELPDVESFKEYFEKTSLDQTITNISSESPELIQNLSWQEFKSRLLGSQFAAARRRGKFLIVQLKNNTEKLVIHFAMTGDLHYVQQTAPRTQQDRFTRLAFQFENSYELRWLNIRKLGKIYLVFELKDIELLQKMGPEPLEINFAG